MNKFCIILLVAAFTFSCQQPEKESGHHLNIIPQPNELRLNEGYFEISSSTLLVYKGLDKSVLNTVSYFQSFLNSTAGFNLELIDDQPSENYIIFKIDSGIVDNTEGYFLEVSSKKIEIIAASARGLFYAIQSIRQILPEGPGQTRLAADTKWIIPALSIKDYPRYSYRGLNLDVSRHFYPVEVIKKQLDLLALYKINVFHWHLTDDQGWRIEIKKYPQLTSIGSRRSKTLIGHAATIPQKYDNEPYEGYYTQEQIKDIVNYANERHISIIPEIEMPGHALAALASYPELGCTGGPYEVATRWGSFDDVICAGKESSYVIIKDILSEVAQLFPGEYIHIGGDESSTLRWRNCNHCQKCMTDNMLATENELANYFIRRVQQIVEDLGKKMAGWDEVMTDKTLSNATIIVWQDDAEIKQAIHNNNKIVKSPNNFLYFDHYQSEPQNHPLAIGGYTPLKDVYSYEPETGDLSHDEERSIIGLQANCWSEYMTDSDQLEFMLYPRLCAFSEICWTTTEQKDRSVFMQKLDQHLERLGTLGISYFYEVPKPILNHKELNFVNTTALDFTNISDKYETRYTTDGSEPDEASHLFTNKTAIKQSATVKAITINKATEEQSKTAIFNFNKLTFQKAEKYKGSTNKGLIFSLHHGRFKSVKEIQNISASQTGVVTHSFIPDSVGLEGFGLIYSGYFKAMKKGIYEFALNSDDGSALYINNEMVVNNDGIHGKKIERGAIALNKGVYKIKVLYFQTTGYQHFNIHLTTPDKNNKRLTPKDFIH
ncbi:family 20 glycosylhydrolase [Carboxylicivirga sp. RSCT41]|uniref:family 20 glycosylhydrolase n=1 Tax=Carboxylicivirga agarovorans TaxID=3417570 RepID=UPI003D34E8F4